MIGATQVSPGQLTAVPATTIAPQFDIGTLLTDIMPLFVLMMVFMMLMPMMQGMAKAFTAQSS